jgi:predicted MFS family arabinose efflux permease
MSRPRVGAASYRAVLALPHARAPFAAATLARLCYGLQGLPLLITLLNATSSYAVSGAAAAGFGLGAALLGPVRARLVARRPWALALLATGYALALAALAIVSAARLPPATAVTIAVLAGLCPPPVGPVMRALWGTITSSEEPAASYMQSALSLDTAGESTAFALGPALAGALIKAVSAEAVLAASAALMLAGCLLLARAAAAGRPAEHVAAGRAGEGRDAFRLRRLWGAGLLTFAVAGAFSAAEIAVLAAWGTVTVGVLLALFPVGGVAGGLAYGRRSWRVPLAARPRMLAVASAACYAIGALAFAPVTVGAVLCLAGAGADILLVTTYQLVEAGVPQARRAEAGAWLNTAYNLGAALGTALGGVLAGSAGPRLSFAVVAAFVGLCAVSAWPAQTLARRL